jgi:hypothetical protein
VIRPYSLIQRLCFICPSSENRIIPQITQIARIRPGFGIAECGRVLEVPVPIDISESCAGGVVPEGPSERSPVRSAGLEKATRPERDDRELLILVKPHAKRPGTILFYLLSSLAPKAGWRDGHIFYTISQHFVLGYFHCVPPGRTLSTSVRQSYVEAHWLLPEPGCDPSPI